MEIKNFSKNVFARISLVLIVITIIGVTPWAVQANCDPVNIMPLGDSITFGQDGTYGGYRGYLYDLLNSAGYDFNFIGSRPDFDVGTAPSDTDHEGWPGWKADQIRDNIYNGLDNQNNGLNWLETAAANPDQGPVDVVLLHIGTNDISGGQNPSDIALEIGQILDEIDEYEAATSSEVWVILARIISRTDSKVSQTATLNNAIQILADARITAGDKIIVVDMENGAGIVYNTTTGDMDDSVHPVDSGYEKMANTWFAVLDNFLPTYCSSESAEDFTIMVLPDTQMYSDNYPEIFQAQTQWIVDNKNTLNIVYVAHEGDIVEHAGDESEWINADNAMNLLDTAMIPYGVVPGNHDLPTTNYNIYFGVSRFSGRSYYGGSYDSDNDDNFTLFNAGGMDFVVVNLNYNNSAPSAAVLTWADGLLQTHSDRRAIVVSHSMLNTDGSFTPAGTAIYTALKGNENLFLMLCGHNHGEARRTETYNGNTVEILLADYQSYTNGGDGFLRILEFSPDNDEIRVKTYSPTRNAGAGEYETDPNSQFALSYDMGGLGGSDAIINFKDGLSPESGYFGTLDTVLSQNDPSINYSGDIALYVDGDDPAGSDADLSTLLYWDISAIPAGSIIQEASITLNVFNASNDSYQVYEMKRDWMESASTWNLYSSTNGWEIPGALGSQDRGDMVLGSFSPTETGPYVINLNSEGMALVQAWVDNPTSNHGFIIANDSATDGADFDSREALTASNRPKLAVRYSGAQPVNQPPMAHDQLVSTSEGASVAITLTASDSDGDTLSFTVVSGPTNGTLNGTAPDLIYTPNPYYTGGDSFTFVANDGELDSSIATVSISVTYGSYALSFDGDDDLVRAGEVPGTGPLTVEAWLNPNDNNADGLVIAGTEGVGGWVIQISSGQLTWWLSTNQGWRNTQHAALLQAGQWYHIAATYDNGSARTFVNGVASIATSVGTLTQGPSLTIGGFGGYFFNGKIDEVRISNNVRYTSDFVPPTGSFALDANTLGLWHFDEGEGQIASDASSSANHCTLGGTNQNDGADPIWVDSYLFENNAPVADDLIASTEENTAVAIILSGSDLDGDPLTFTVKSGPSSGTLSGTAPELTYTPDADFTGIDSFTYIANDGTADSDEATVTITVNLENQAPIVEAGPAQTVTLPDSALLDGTVTDDGLPAGSTLTTTWSMQSGDGTVTFGNSAAVDTTASFSGAGTYVLRLTATDSNKSAVDEVTITVDPDTQPPNPNPPTWATPPYATGTSSISMTATTVSDPSGVEYYFDELSGTSGGSDSGWQDSASFTDTGLNADTTFTYRVRARDKSANQNQTAWSSELSATTDAEAPKSGCGTAPMYRDSGRTNLSASNSVGNALLPLLLSMMALGLWRVKRAGRSRK
jgi:lysophospholipase L1-like esterase